MAHRRGPVNTGIRNTKTDWAPALQPQTPRHRILTNKLVLITTPYYASYAEKYKSESHNSLLRRRLQKSKQEYPEVATVTFKAQLRQPSGNASGTDLGYAIFPSPATVTLRLPARRSFSPPCLCSRCSTKTEGTPALRYPTSESACCSPLSLPRYSLWWARCAPLRSWSCRGKRATRWDAAKTGVIERRRTPNRPTAIKTNLCAYSKVESLVGEL